MTDPIRLDLPYPPTTNNLFATVGRRRVKSSGYTAWLQHAGLCIKPHHKGKITGPYELLIVGFRPDNRKRDIGNLEKPVSDLLVKAGVVRDDSDAAKITLAWHAGEPCKPGSVWVEVQSIPTREAA